MQGQIDFQSRQARQPAPLVQFAIGGQSLLGGSSALPQTSQGRSSGSDSGAAFLISTESIPINAPLYTDIGSLTIHHPGGGRLPLIADIMLAVFAVGAVLLQFTEFGTNVYALGGSRQSTALMGVRVAPTIIRVYMLSSVLASLSGIVFSFYTAGGYALSAVGVELDTIAAVVIGGTLLTGGAGFMFGTLMGLLIQGLIQTYITFDGNLSSWWTEIVTGFLLFA
ncbi:ribose/xylose/arabinose/galactoside ABC-type transport system permease subunit [Bradyrhizobium sp. AZCC 2289]